MKFDFTDLDKMAKDKEVQAVNLKLTKEPYFKFKENIKRYKGLTQRDVFEMMIKQFNSYCDNKDI